MDVEAFIERWEGRRRRVYRDSVGKQTAGVGRNIDDVPFRDDEIDLMLKNDVIDCISDLLAIFTNPLDQVRWTALIDMRLNLGSGGFRNFQHMIEALKAGDWERASKEALSSLWAKQVGQRAQVDAEMIRTGEWQNV